MTNEPDQTIEQQAIHWQLQLDDCDSSGWEQFTLWLEADPRHVAAFDAVVAAGDSIDRALPRADTITPAIDPIIPSNDNATIDKPERWSARRWLGAAVAACLVLAGTGWAGDWFLTSQRYIVATGPGEQRGLVMADGSRITMNGSSRLILDHRDPRYAALDDGEATFEVQHDPAHPFALKVGDAEVRDVGTVFNVIREPGVDLVEIKQGRVNYAGGGRIVPLMAGQALRAERDSGQLVVEPRRIEAIGAWRTGRLSYDLETFDGVAQDISRNLGVSVSVDPRIRDKQFTGTILIDRDRVRFFRNLGILLDTPVAGSGNKWRIAANKH